MRARRPVASHVASGRYAAAYAFHPMRICVMGSSAGGHLAVGAGTTHGVRAVEGTLGAHSDRSSDVQCAVEFFAPTDLTSSQHGEAEVSRGARLNLFGGWPEENPERAREASPFQQVDPEGPPFLIVHGTRDPAVP